MSTENIQKFLAEAYTDEKLAALLAHAQDGKLAYRSCCCLIGIPTANHALRGYMPEFKTGRPLPIEYQHHLAMRFTEHAAQAEKEFYNLGSTDAELRERLIPLILSEIERRAAEKAQVDAVRICEAVER